MIDYLFSNPWLCWLIAGVFFLILELATTALVSIWFVPSAVIVSLCSLFVRNVYLQISLFLVLSAVFLLLFKALYKKHTNRTEDLNNRLVGKTAVAVQPITENDGKVLVGDVYWRAVSREPIPKQANVQIENVNGTTLVVAKRAETVLEK